MEYWPYYYSVSYATGLWERFWEISEGSFQDFVKIYFSDSPLFELQKSFLCIYGKKGRSVLKALFLPVILKLKKKSFNF